MVSQSSLSLFERGKSVLSIDKFFHSLERMNVTNEEFTEIYNYYYIRDFSLYQFSLDLNDAYYKSDSRTLLKTLNSLQSRSVCYQDLSDETNTFLQLAVESFLFRISKKRHTNRTVEIKQLYDYLENITIWGFFEIYLMSCCAYLFDKKQLEKLGDKILPNLSIYQHSAFIYNIALQMLHNMIFASLINEFTSLAAIFLKYAESLETTERLLMIKSCFSYDRGYYLVLIGKKNEGLEIIKKIRDFYNLLGETALIQKMEDDISFLELY